MVDCIHTLWPVDCGHMSYVCKAWCSCHVLPLSAEQPFVYRRTIRGGIQLHLLYSVCLQWNLSNPDTLGTEKSVLIREVSLFQGL